MAISAKFLADFSQFTEAVKGAEGSLKSLETGAQTLGPAILASLASTQIRQFAADVKNVANEFIGAFAEEEAAVKKLGVALQAQGTAQYMAQYTALAAEFQRTTVSSDDLIVSMTALLVQVGGVMPVQMKEALTAASNLSAGLGISLEAATLLVAKAFGQGGEQLGKLKALLGDTVPKGADMAAVMAAINAKFGGQAAAQVETYTGQMARLNNQMSDFKERVGSVLVEALTPLLNAFAAMPESMQTVVLGVVAVGTALAPLALSVAAVSAVITPLIPLIGTALSGAFAVIVPYLGPAGIIAAGLTAWFVVFKNLDVFIWAAVKSWEALKGAFKSAASAIVNYARELYEGVKTWLVDKFQGIVATVQAMIDRIIAAWRAMKQLLVSGSIIPDMMSEIAAEFQKLDGIMVQPVLQATMQAAGGFQAMGAQTLGGGGMALAPAGGGINVTITVNGNMLGTSAALADEVRSALVDAARKSGQRLGSGA